MFSCSAWHPKGYRLPGQSQPLAAPSHARACAAQGQSSARTPPVSTTTNKDCLYYARDGESHVLSRCVQVLPRHALREESRLGPPAALLHLLSSRKLDNIFFADKTNTHFDPKRPRRIL